MLAERGTPPIPRVEPAREEALPDESHDETYFRLEVRKWLEGTGFAPAAIGGLVSPWADHAEAAVVDARAFQRALFDAGYAGLSWPELYGGRGLTPRHEYIFDQEAGRYELPSGVFSIGLGMCGPTLLAHGTEEQKARYIPPMLQGEEIWSQVFSEPGAGSDLAALRTRAVRDGDMWTLTGQKVWTSGALISQYGLVLARSDVKRPRHAGLTMFIVDLAAPGVSLRPLKQMTGHAKFAEVFLDGVRVRDDHRVGDENDGWRCAITTLMNERFSVGGLKYAQRGGSAQLILDKARALGLAGDPVVRQQLAQVWVTEAIFGYLHHRVGAGGHGRPRPRPRGVDPQAGHGGLHRARRRDRSRPGRRGRRGLGSGPAGGRRVVGAALRCAVLHDRRRDHRGAEEPCGRTGSRVAPGQRRRPQRALRRVDPPVRLDLIYR